MDAAFSTLLVHPAVPVQHTFENQSDNSQTTEPWADQLELASLKILTKFDLTWKAGQRVCSRLQRRMTAQLELHQL